MSIMHTKNGIIEGILQAPINYEGKNRKTIGNLSQNVKDILQSIYTNIQNGTSTEVCTPLRKAFEKFDQWYKKQINEKLQDINWVDEQQEPLDVVNILDRIFKLPKTTKKKIEYEGETREENFPFCNVFVTALEDDIDIDSYIPIQTENFYNDQLKKNVTKVTTIESTSGIMIYVKRGYATNSSSEKKSFAQITCRESYRINANTQVNLTSLTIHHGSTIHGGHYTSYIKHQDAWYHFDDLDMNKKMQHIGSFKNIPKDAFRNVVSLVYI
jgi:hypothetical protein